MARQRTNRRDHDDDALPVRRSRRPRWRRRLFLAVLAAGGAVAAGPAIVANTPLRNWVLSQALPPDVVRAAARGARFSWMDGQSLDGVTLTDSQGNDVATIESISTDRSLVALAVNPRSLGKIFVVRPVVHARLHAGGSNIEDIVDQIAAAKQRQRQPDDSTTGGARFSQLEIVEASIVARDATTGQAWRVDQFTASLGPGQDDDEVWNADGSGVFSLGQQPAADPVVAEMGQKGVFAGGDPGDQLQGAGRFKFHFSTPEANRRQLDLLADRLPLAPLEPWLVRRVPGARLTGTASTDVKLTWATPPAHDEPNGLEAPPALAVADIWAAGKLDAADVRFTADALSGDVVELPATSIAVDATLTGGRLEASRFVMRGDWLQVDAKGEFDFAQLARLSMADLPSSDAVLTSRIDLPHLTRMLPRTLKIRPGVRIDSGAMEVTLSSNQGDAGRSWAMAAAVEKVLGVDGQRPIRWNDPVEFGADFAETPEGPQLRRLLVRSPFASVRAEGSTVGLEGEFDLNLDQLAEQLGQVVDMSQWRLRGSGNGKFSWRNTGEDKFAANAESDLRQIDVHHDGKPIWTDPQLRIELQANGARRAATPVRIDAASAHMRGPSDAVEIELLEPVDLTANNREWSVRFKGAGPLGSWAGRLRPWVAGLPDELEGQSTLSARVRARRGFIEVIESEVNVRDFRTRLGGVAIVEPRIEASGDLRWDAAAAAIDSQTMQFASSTIAGRVRGLSLRFADAGPPTLRGDAAFRGDLERLAAWAGRVGAADGMWPRGEAEGRIQLASDDQRASAMLALKSTRPISLVRTSSSAVPNPAEPTVVWSEPSLQMGAECVYTHGDDRLRLSNVKLDGETIKLMGSGVIDQVRGDGLVQCDVNLQYDAGQLASLLANYLGPGVRFDGANQARLLASGQLRASQTVQTETRIETAALPARSRDEPAAHWSRRWTITAEGGWSTGNVYGLPIGPAQLAANVRNGRVEINPLELAVGQGHINAHPHVILDPAPQTFQLAPGPLVSNVAISADVSDAMLKYAAPILASATRISGTFSLFNDGLQAPIGDPQKARGAGRLTIHQLSVLPGPGLAEIIQLVQRLEAISRGRPDGGLLGALAQPAAPLGGISMNERTVDVQVVDGRVYHRNLEFLVDDVPVRSYGSVGFDETIELVIQTPIQAKWVGDKPALQPLVGQIIEIPVHGTLTRWRVDERAVTNFLAQAAQAAVGGVLGNELNKALEDLFRRR